MVFTDPPPLGQVDNVVVTVSSVSTLTVTFKNTSNRYNCISPVIRYKGWLLVLFIANIVRVVLLPL